MGKSSNEWISHMCGAHTLCIGQQKFSATRFANSRLGKFERVIALGLETKPAAAARTNTNSTLVAREAPVTEVERVVAVLTLLAFYPQRKLGADLVTLASGMTNDSVDDHLLDAARTNCFKTIDQALQAVEVQLDPVNFQLLEGSETLGYGDGELLSTRTLKADRSFKFLELDVEGGQVGDEAGEMCPDPRTTVFEIPGCKGRKLQRLQLRHADVKIKKVLLIEHGQRHVQSKPSQVGKFIKGRQAVRPRKERAMDVNNVVERFEPFPEVPARAHEEEQLRNAGEEGGELDPALDQRAWEVERGKDFLRGSYFQGVQTRRHKQVLVEQWPDSFVRGVFGDHDPQRTHVVGYLHPYHGTRVENPQ